MKISEETPANIGNPTKYTVREVTQIVVGLSGGESELVCEPRLKGGDLKRRCPQVSGAEKVRGWEPHLPAHERLRQMLDWFARRLDSSQEAATTG
jgi:UDP-glucuronate decarboxylase